MLKDLKILNGHLDLKFNEYIYEYTVSVDEDINKLEFSYKLDDDVAMEILNNELITRDTQVTIKVSKNNEEETYILNVHKNTTNAVAGIEIFKDQLLINKEEIDLYKVQALGISIFFILVIIFTLLFRKKKL